MANPKQATTARGGKRFYDWRGERYWSVTTILGGGVPKPALVPWGMKAVAEAAVSRRGALAEMLADCRTPEACRRGEFCEYCDDAIRWLKGLPYANRDRAADLGTSVHEAIEAHVLGKPMPPWPTIIRPRMEQFVRFLEEWQPEFEMSEASVYNRTERYAGTLDGIAVIQGRRLIIDVKSGKGVYPEAALQLSMYRYAEFVGSPDGEEVPMPAVDGAAVLHLTDHGYELVDVRADEQVYRAALFAREVFRWQEETSKTVIHGAMSRFEAPLDARAV